MLNLIYDYPNSYHLIIFKRIYFNFKSIFLDSKSNLFNWIWIEYRLDNILNVENPKSRYVYFILSCEMLGWIKPKYGNIRWNLYKVRSS